MNVNNQIEIVVHNTLEVLRKIIRSNSALLHGINETYENALFPFLRIIPEENLIDLINTYDVIAMLVSCIDVGKLIDESKKIKCKSANISVQKLTLELIQSKIKDVKKRQLTISLLGKLQPAFDCFDYILDNMDICIGNCEIFKTVEDIF